MNIEHPVDRRWTMRQRDWAVVFWIAFLAATAGAFIPYGLSFAFLYGICLLASALTMFMIRTGPQQGHAKGEGRLPKAEIRHHSEDNPDLGDEDWK